MRPPIRTRRARALPVAALALTAAALSACAPGIHASATPLADAEAAARAALAAEHTIGAAPADARTVGVAPFVATDSALVPLGYALADLLLTDLAQSRQLTVVDRTVLHALLRELELAGGGQVDSTTAPRTGRLLRARQLVVGGVTSTRGAGAIDVNSRVTDVASGRVDVAATTETSLDDVLEAQKALVLRLFDALGVTLTPAERAAVERRQTRNLAALLAYGRAVRFEVQGRFAPAAAEYARAARLDPGFGLAQSRLYDIRAHADVWPLPVVPAGGMFGRQTAGTGTLGSAMVDRINRTYPMVPSSTESHGAADPIFPVTTATILISVILP